MTAFSFAILKTGSDEQNRLCIFFREISMRGRLTKKERSWILYDVGNSAFTLLVTTIMPLYFNALAKAGGVSSVNYLACWGYAASISTIIVAFLGPVMGTITDYKGLKKPIFLAFVLVGAGLCCLLGLLTYWLAFLVVFIIAKSAYSASLVFYDSMLVDVTSDERSDEVSSAGYAWGYIGSVVPFIVCLLLVLMHDKIGISQNTAFGFAFVITALWWVVFTVPVLKNYKQLHYVEKREGMAIVGSFKRLGHTLKNVTKEKNVFLFLLAFFFYIDGVYTIIAMATSYGTSVGLESTSLLLALLLTQFVAFPCALIVGKLAKKYNTASLIRICIIGYTCIAVFAIFLKSQWQFWVLAVAVGVFQGGIQALSRSYFARIVPNEQSGEYFGLYDICGKGASFMGTMLVSVMTQVSGSPSVGVGSITVMFIIGIFLFNKAAALNEKPADAEAA